jgi:hypothetical protein
LDTWVFPFFFLCCRSHHHRRVTCGPVILTLIPPLASRDNGKARKRKGVSKGKNKNAMLKWFEQKDLEKATYLVAEWALEMGYQYRTQQRALRYMPCGL